MLISAGNNLEGYKVLEYKELVIGVARSTDGISYRQIAVKKVIRAAESVGCNAILNLRMEIYPIGDDVQEITVYGNAVFVESTNGQAVISSKPAKINLEAYIPKPKTPVLTASIQDGNGFKFVTCPKCGTKYKTEIDENGEAHIKGFEDADDDEPGLQIFCLRCGTKFTVPNEK